MGLKWQICKKAMCFDCRLRKLNQLNLFIGVACTANLMTVLLLVLKLLLFALIQMHFDDDYGDYRSMGVGPRWVGLGHESTSSPGSGLGWIWVDD